MRTLTRMLATGTLAIAAAFTASAQGESGSGRRTLFLKCASVLDTPDYASLRVALPNLPIEEVDRCQRLSNREFVVTANPPGPYNGPASNFFYCDLRGDKPSCEEDTAGFIYPDLALLREFEGARGKRFVLWRVSSLHRGVFATGFHIFQFLPRSEDTPHGYALYMLPDAWDLLSYVEGGDAQKPCNGLSAPEARKLEAFEVVNAGTEAVALNFRFKVTRCDTNETVDRVFAFRLVNGRFAQVSPLAPR